MKIVPVESIPKKIEDTPLNNLNKIFITGKKMESLCVEKNGIGLSACQVGIPWKFFIYKEDKKFHYMVNCDYACLNDEKFIGLEGCLSLLDSNGNSRRFRVPRYKEIEVSGHELIFDEKLCIAEIKKSFKFALESVILKHEIDHQKGILISDIGQEVGVF